jgi:hypothetical protein
MPGSSTTPGRSDLAMVRPKRVAFRARNSVGARGLAFAAQWLAYALPYRRFVGVLTDANARLGADVDRYTFIVVDLHHLLLPVSRRTSSPTCPARQSGLRGSSFGRRRRSRQCSIGTEMAPSQKSEWRSGRPMQTLPRGHEASAGFGPSGDLLVARCHCNLVARCHCNSKFRVGPRN